MAFVNEFVPENDWELYNSFNLYSATTGKRKKAGENSCWIVDRDREIFFILTGVETRENIMDYTLVWQGKKVDITYYEGRSLRGGVSDGTKIYYDIYSIGADIELKKYEKEIIEIIKEFLQFEITKECVFEYIAEIRYRGEVKQVVNISEIVEWIKNYENPLDNLESFVKGLHGEF